MAWSRISEAWDAVQRLATRSPRLTNYLETRRSLSRDAVVDRSDDLIAAQDDAFRFIYFNDAYRSEFEALWGIELTLGASMIELLAPWPDDLQNAKHLWSRALGGESFTDISDIDRQLTTRWRPIGAGADRGLRGRTPATPRRSR